MQGLVEYIFHDSMISYGNISSLKLVIKCAFSWQALDLVPKKIHERSPIFLGSYDDVEEIKALYAAEEKKE